MHKTTAQMFVMNNKNINTQPIIHQFHCYSIANLLLPMPSSLDLNCDPPALTQVFLLLTINHTVWPYQRFINLSIMNQTPYEQLLRKSRQRKAQVVHRIEQKSLKSRSISHNMQISNDLSPNPEAKSKEKHEKGRMNFASCLKKSFYYRKFLNRAGEGQLDHEEFHRLNETFNKVGTRQSENQKNPGIFREIWENELQRNYSLKGAEQKNLQLVLIAKKNLKNLGVLSINPAELRRTRQGNYRKNESVTEVSPTRRMSLDYFQLQITGNKKHIKSKHSTPSKPPNKSPNTAQQKDTNTQQTQLVKQDTNTNSASSQQISRILKLKQSSRLSKRLLQSLGDEPKQRKSICIKINKIRQDRNRVADQFKITTSTCFNKYALQQFAAEIQPRDIRSSWNPSDQPLNQRYRLQTSQKCRGAIRKRKRVAQDHNQPNHIQDHNQTNDIQGWNIKPVQQEQHLEILGS